MALIGTTKQDEMQISDKVSIRKLSTSHPRRGTQRVRKIYTSHTHVETRKLKSKASSQADTNLATSTARILPSIFGNSSAST
uniref:Uncharacterized protein n=1 Tax=Nelumbo nucifera TaxID=4432 RepID=A0A822XU12_NELNU|nr:TPA_asm: hypothetical protein HUJ06_023778 [Nelumbo nucifera]